MNQVLIATAVEAEKNAILQGLNKPNVDVVVAGVGPIAAAIGTAKVMATKKYDLVLSTGIAGGFQNKTELGSLVVSDEIIAADLGAQTPEGFLSLDELGFGKSRLQSDPNWVQQVYDVLKQAGIPSIIGPILTVSTVTGTANTTQELIKRIPHATAEAMEGFGIASVAYSYGVPFLEIRAISNVVGPRDRKNWKIKEALNTLSLASSALQKIF